MYREFETVIGLEVHCQLATQTKIFCGCPSKMSDGRSVAHIEVNSNTCPICAGHPGTLPVMNEKVVEYAVMAGLATHCQIRPESILARKNYFYPDLPKGYQISQYEQPICESGWLDIRTSQGEKRIRIHRIHMEEDAGKSIHHAGFSVVNLNRAGVPLIEIVSEPDIRSPEEAGAYLRSLHGLVTHLGICDGNMEEGNFRCDVNISVRTLDEAKAGRFGTRAEIKNVNSFRFVEKAIEYEIHRQEGLVRSGGKVVQETRSYDSAKNVTLSLRTKEEAQDYRYFPDPDLIPIQLNSQWIEQIRSALPELPEQLKNRLMSDWGLSLYDADAIISSKALFQFFEKVMQQSGLQNPGEGPGEKGREFAKPVANWLTGEVSRLLNEEGIEINQSNLTPEHLVDLVTLIQKQVLSSTGAKQVLSIIWKTGEKVETVVEREGLKQVSEAGALSELISKTLAAFPKQAAEYRAGKEKLLGFFVGKVMKESGGKANPALLNDLFKKALSEENS